MSALSPRTLLHLFGGHDYELNALSYALAMARHDRAHLRILHINEAPFLSEYFGREAYSGHHGDDMAGHDVETADLTHAAMAYVRAYCRHEAVGLRDSPSGMSDVASAEFRSLAGTPATVLAREALACDLVLSDWNNQPGGDLSMARTVLFDARRPVLLLPRQAETPMSPAGFARQVVFAWDGSRTSAQALRAAIPHMLKAEEVHLLRIISPGGDQDVLAEADTLAYLRSHGVAATLVRIDRGDRSIGQAILEESHHRNAGLLALGAYGHGYLREMIFGGVTQHVLKHGRLPLLLAH